MQQDWYAKLAEGGFEDAEELIGGELMLKQIAGHAYRDADDVQIECKESYFRLLSGNVKQERFRSKTDRIILLLRSDGAKIQQIVDTLMFLGKRRCRASIRFIIRKYEMRWGMRQYSPKQLNKKVERSA